MEAGLVHYDQDNNPHCYQDSEGKSRCYWVPTVVGITSWITSCGYVDYPEVYGRVSRVVNWIQSITGKYIEILLDEQITFLYYQKLKASVSITYL